MATRLGVTAELRDDYSLVLGTGEVSVLDMASAYSTFADRGMHIDPYVIRRVESSSGEVLFDASTDVEGEQVISEEVADTVNSVLSGVLVRGTGQGANIGVAAAGKTGTTTDSRDAWFAGYTCNLTAAVWMGYEQPRPMEDFRGEEVSGGTWPAQIWADFMSEATAADQECEFPATDAGERLANQSLAGQRTTTTDPSQRRSTTTTSPVGSTTSVPQSTTTTQAPTTTAPPPSTTAAPPSTTAAPPTTAVAAAGGG
jgi:penicillin-binding protein 1A